MSTPLTILLPGTRRDLAAWLRVNRRKYALALATRWTWEQDEKRTYFSRLKEKPFRNLETGRTSFFIDACITPF
jgi:hypothetical protein